VSASDVDELLEICEEWCTESGISSPFESHEEMHAVIDSSKLADIPWQCLETGITDPVDESAPWTHTTYEVWYRDPESVVSMMLGNPDFDGQFDLRPYIDLDAEGSRRWSNVMSGNIAWRHSVSKWSPSPQVNGINASAHRMRSSHLTRLPEAPCTVQSSSEATRPLFLSQQGMLSITLCISQSVIRITLSDAHIGTQSFRSPSSLSRRVCHSDRLSLLHAGC
jgi:Plavaka transposase